MLMAKSRPLTHSKEEEKKKKEWFILLSPSFSLLFPFLTDSGQKLDINPCYDPPSVATSGLPLSAPSASLDLGTAHILCSWEME